MERVVFDYSKLDGKITEVYKSRSNFADAMGISKGALSNKLNGVSRLSAEDMFQAMKLLEIPNDEIRVYFFSPKS
jgi:transcriptional regulator with XRE-family HTH domain